MTKDTPATYRGRELGSLEIRLAAQLKRLRADSGKLQETAARQIGVNRQRVSATENGREPASLIYIERCLAIYGYRVEFRFKPIKKRKGKAL